MKALSYLLSTLVVFLIQSASAGNFRVFTDASGREIEVSLKNYNPKNNAVQVQLKSKAVKTVNIAIFSQQDQRYIREWHQAGIMLSESKLRLSVGKKTVDSGEQRVKKGGWSAYDPGMRFKDVLYDIEITNRNRQDLKNLLVECCLYKESTIDETVEEIEYRPEYSGTVPLSSEKLPRRTEIVSVFERIHIDSLSPQQQYEKSTKIIQIRNGREGKRNKELTEGRVRDVDDDLLGIRIRVHLSMPSGETFMKEYAFPGDLIKNTKWDPPASVYIDTYHCLGVSYESKKQVWEDAGFQITEGDQPLGDADLGFYDVVVLDQPFPAKRKPFSESDIQTVTEFVHRGGALFLLCEKRFDPASPAASTKITKSFGVTINADGIRSDTMCSNTGLVPELSSLAEWKIEDMGSSISITGSAPVPIYKTKDGENTMVLAPYGKGHALVAGDYESFAFDSKEIYKDLVLFLKEM